MAITNVTKARGVCEVARTSAWLLGAALACGCTVSRPQDTPPARTQETERAPASGSATPLEATPPGPGVPPPISIEAGVGFTADPDTFLVALEGDYWVQHNVGVGPLLQLGFSDSHTIIAPTLNVKGVLDLTQPDLQRVRPYAEGGVGFAYIDRDSGHHDDGDLGLLFDVGFGVNVDLTDRVGVGTGVLFDWMPAELEDEHFMFAWRVLSLDFRF